MDDHVVYRDTCAGRKPPYPRKLGTAPIFSIYWRTILSISQVDTPGSTASGELQCCLRDFPWPSASGKARGSFQHDHVKSSRASKTRRMVSSTFPGLNDKQLSLLAVNSLRGSV